ncbi:MAG: iron-containing alcohol dehydrogenase [Bacteroidales bacterium]|nr:iron-containing alcohol dehydrogenase [Bacteroidales bacterium]
MLGNFKYSNPTKLYFGNDSLKFLSEELKNYGPVVMMTYGGGSIKKNGIYDAVINILNQAGKTVIEDAGVMPNPTVEKLYEGAALAKKHNVDLILAVGGGSTIDYSKGVAASAYCEQDPWAKYYVQQQDPDCKIIPVGSVLTMVGTGSEMNGGSVITNHKENLKIGKVFDDRLMPKFSILNPEFTFSLPQYQMIAGFFDTMSHIMEQYFSNFDDNTTDYIAEGLMRSLVHSSLIAVKDPHNYEARSNIMWTATWALNTLLKKGKNGDWMVHMIGQAIGAHTDATHGMTLSAVSVPYYKYILEGICANQNKGIEKFKRFAVNVWNIPTENKTDVQIATQGIDALAQWMKEIGVVMHSSELGLKEDMLQAVANSTITYPTDYRTLSHDDVVEILRRSL